MIESFFRTFQNSREHWVFWPFLLLIVQMAMYNFLLSKNGYVAYIEKIKEKEILTVQIEELVKKKTALGKKLAHVENDNEAIKEFIRKLYFYDDRYIVVKFMDEEKSREGVKETKMGLIFIQRAYILISTVVFSVFTAFFWKRYRASLQNEV
ncbi:MAG: septum formation initiator family protein [Spirochaetia bacterium]|nr:septum formation initiator family protein [Spirochaetia bacterium]